jgi:hypothetical protein
VAGNSSCVLTVVFAPTQNGPLTGTLTLTTAFQQLTAQLSGIGVGTPVLTLTPNSIRFGSENLQQASAPQIVLVSNTGNAPDTITGVTTQSATPGTIDYRATTNCGVLAPGITCTITVTFAPSVGGPDDGTLLVAASVPSTGVTASLYGYGNTLAWAGGQAPTATVPAGQTATYALQLQVVGYAGAVQVQCAGLPAGAECGFAVPPQVSQSGYASVEFTVATGPDVVSAQRRFGQRLVLALCLPWLLLPMFRLRVALPTLLACFGFVCLGLLGGCGSPAASSAAARTPPGSYTFTVTASGGGMVSSIPVELVVE